MNCLLLFLALLWTVHSVRQVKVDVKLDYKKCLSKEYFCLVTPDAVSQSQNPNAIVPSTEKLKAINKPIGIMIKPLAPNKWLLIMHSEVDGVNVDKGIFLLKARKNSYHDDIPKGIVAGCNKNGALYSPSESFIFDVLIDDLEFVPLKKIKCVGILRPKTSDISIANLLQVDADQKLFFVVEKIETDANDIEHDSQHIRTLQKTSTLKENVDFAGVDSYTHCDFEKLKPAPYHVLQTHNFREVDTYSDFIDCTKNMFETATSSVDLIIKPDDAEYIVIQNITCEHHILYYSADDKTEIPGYAIVACGERPMCKMLPPAICADSKCADPVGKCNADKSKCETLECAKWLINEDQLYLGKLECRKESVEDFSRTRWYAEINNKRVQVDKGSCQNDKNIQCRVKHPIRSECENGREGCATATIVKRKIYCPLSYDLKFKDNIDGKEYEIEDEIRCDFKSGNWTVNGTSTFNTTVKNVYCILNKSKENVLLGGLPFTSQEEDDKWYEENVVYFYYAIGAIIVIEILAYVIVKMYDCIQDRKRRKEAERLKEWRRRTREERYKLRPENRHPKKYPLGYKDLRKMDAKALCEGLWRDFSLYAPEERVMFLENCLIQFGSKEKYVHLAIPLLLKCTEADEELVNHKQPLHHKVVKIAFTILRILCISYSVRGDQASADRMKAVMGIRAANITFKLGLERRTDEDFEATALRNLAIDVLLFANHKQTMDGFIKMFDSMGENIDTPLRKYVWAVAVKREQKNFKVVQDMMFKEFDRMRNGTHQAGDIRWGDKISHYVFALCAGPERLQTEKFFNDVLREPFYTPAHIMSGFQAMLEVFDYNHLIARFLFGNRHHFIRVKIPPMSLEYKALFRLIYHYVVYWPNKDLWLMQFYGNVANFNLEEKLYLEKEMAMAMNFVEIYTAMPGYSGIVQCCERWLSKVEFIKTDEREERDKPKPLVYKQNSEDDSEEEGVKSWQDHYGDLPWNRPETTSERRFKKKKQAKAKAESEKRKKEAAESMIPIEGKNLTDFIEDGDKKAELNTGKEKEEEKTAIAESLEEQTAAEESAKKAEEVKKEEKPAAPATDGTAAAAANEAATQEEKSGSTSSTLPVREEKTQGSI